MKVASKPQKRSPLHRYPLTNEQVEIIVDAVEMRRAYLAIAVNEVASSEMDDVARDLAAMDSLLDRLRAAPTKRRQVAPKGQLSPRNTA